MRSNSVVNIATSPLSFQSYPSSSFSPFEYKIRDNSVYRVTCAQAKDFSKKSWLFWKEKHPIFWFALVTEEPTAKIASIETKHQNVSLDAIIYENPSRLNGDVIGPFKSIAEIKRWVNTGNPKREYLKPLVRSMYVGLSRTRREIKDPIKFIRRYMSTVFIIGFACSFGVLALGIESLRFFTITFFIFSIIAIVPHS